MVYLLAILEAKKIISNDEAIAIAEQLAHKPQSTYYQDALKQITEILGKVKKDTDTTEKN